MKIFKIITGVIYMVALAFASFTPISTTHAISQLQGSDTETPTATETATQPPTATVTPTATETPPPPAGERPVIVLSYYKANEVSAGEEFKLEMSFRNVGQHYAHNIIVTFQGEGFIPTGSGGMQSIPEMAPGNSASINQNFIASADLLYAQNPTITINVNYTDVNGTGFNNAFIVPISIKKPAYSGVSKPTATPTAIPRPRLIIESYTTDLPKLQAGNSFKLSVNVRNMGNVDAKNITLVLGGASPTGSGDGTPVGGVSGGAADLSKFAPLGTSNLYFMGDLAPANTKIQTMELVVNVATDPGVYPLKISFAYNDPTGILIFDDQVITLLIYSLPNLSASYYQPVSDFFSAQPGMLPIQITNLGRRSIVLGEMEITSNNGYITNNRTTIGTIDPGGYFTIDAEYWPEMPGEGKITLLISYTDDFTNASSVELTLPPVNVIEAMPFPPDDGSGGGEVIPEPQPSGPPSWWQILLGFLGLSGG